MSCPAVIAELSVPVWLSVFALVLCGGAGCARAPDASSSIVSRESVKEVLTVSAITVERDPGRERLEELGVDDWGIWAKEVSEFPWTYDMQETCYFLEGEVVVTPEGGEPVKVGKGDLVTFPRGMSCRWDIRRDVRKHYMFE